MFWNNFLNFSWTSDFHRFSLNFRIIENNFYQAWKLFEINWIFFAIFSKFIFFLFFYLSKFNNLLIFCKFSRRRNNFAKEFWSKLFGVLELEVWQDSSAIVQDALLWFHKRCQSILNHKTGLLPYTFKTNFLQVRIYCSVYV